MKQGKIVLDHDFTISKIDEKVFSSFVEMLGRCIYGGLYEPGHPTADGNAILADGNLKATLKKMSWNVIRLEK